MNRPALLTRGMDVPWMSLPGWKRAEGLVGFGFISYNMSRNEKLAEAA